MNYWRLVTHHEHPQLALDEYRHRSIIALGWGAIGHLAAMQANGPNPIRRALLNIPDYVSPRRARSAAECLWDFYQEMQQGDLVVLSLGESGGIQHDVVEVIGGYEWVPTPVFPGPNLLENDYHHVRRVRWRSDLDGVRVWASRSHSGDIYKALIRLA